MKRKDFLQGLGLVGAGALLPATGAAATRTTPPTPTTPPDCILIPSETAGPFPLDLTENQTFFRQDVREDRQGVRLDLKLKIIGLANCQPMPNVRVNIWHCDKDGNYSGYNTQTGLTYLRGYQIADNEGEVDFITVFPGWYNGRVCHIHFQVYVSSVYAAVSQLTFDHAATNALYAANPTLYTKGADPLTPQTDGIFANSYTYQLATLEANPATGGYQSYLQVTVNGTGVVGLAEATPETGGVFKLSQNYPNPYAQQTTIPFELYETADVHIELWDLNGKKVATTPIQTLAAGVHHIPLSLATWGLPLAKYAYQLVATTHNGTFRQSKLLSPSAY